MLSNSCGSGNLLFFALCCWCFSHDRSFRYRFPSSVYMPTIPTWISSFSQLLSTLSFGGLQGRESSGGLAACGAEWPRPFPMSCTISLLRCRGGPMCPPGGNTFCFPPSGANTYHPRPGVLVFVIFLILLQYFYKYKGQRHKNFLHTPIRRKHPPWANPWGMVPTERKQL